MDLENDRIKTYLDAIDYGVAEATKKGSPPAIVLAIIPNDNKTRYDAIKKLCCHDKPSKPLPFHRQSVLTVLT